MSGLPRWFLLLNGVALLLLGGALLWLRVREQGLPWWVARRLFGITWALLCLAMGGALLAMAAGVLDQPGQPGQPGQPRRQRQPIEFPTDR